jgi:hypothetical protein
MKKLVACLLAYVLAGQFSMLRAEQSASAATQIHVSSAAYLRSVIESLSRTHLAFKAVNDSGQRRSMVDRMTAVQNASIEVGIAKRSLQEFTSAENETLALSAGGVVVAYEFMQKSLSISLAAYEQLDAAKSEEDLVGLRRQISDAKVLYQQASNALVEATSLAFMSGIVPDPKDPKNHIAISMTAPEKKELINLLESRFGPSLRKKTDDDSGPLKAAQGLVAMLDKNWAHAN